MATMLKNNCTYLFLVALGLLAMATAFSNCRKRQLLTSVASLAEERGLYTADSGVMAPRPCGIFPDQGWNPGPLHCQVDSQLLDHHGSPSNGLHLHSTYRRLPW